MGNATCSSALVHTGHTVHTHTISDPDNLERRMGLGDLSLARHAQQGKEDDHRTAAGCEPKGTSDAIVVADQRRTQHGGGPEPGLEEFSGLDEEDP